MAEEHIKAFSHLKSVEINGIYSRNASKARDLSKRYKIDTTTRSIKDLYLKCKPDAVIVAVPELALEKILLESTSYQWVHLIEKPAGFNFSNAKKILILNKKRNSKILVALNRRQFESTRTVVTKLKNLNSKRVIHVTDQQDPIKALSLGQPQLVIKNWMFANSIHLIDYFTLFGRGDVVHVNTQKYRIGSRQKIIKAEIDFSSGDVGFYTAYWNMPGPWSVSCSSGVFYWELKPLEQLSERNLDEPYPIIQSVHKKDKQFKPGLLNQAEEFIKFLDGRESTVPTLDESFKSMLLVNKIYKGLPN